MAVRRGDRRACEACEALATPVTGGNVSFYNESGDSAIDPTPVIGMLGVLSDHRLRVPLGFPRPGLAVYMLGETFAELGGSEFAEAVLGEVAGHAAGHRPRGGARARRSAGAAAPTTLLASAHDCGDGGIAVALAECAIATARVRGRDPDGSAAARGAVQRVGVAGRGQRRAGRRGRRGVPLAAEHGVAIARIGETGGPRAVIEGRSTCRRRARRGLGDGHPPVARRGCLSRRFAPSRSTTGRRSCRSGAANARDADRPVARDAGRCRPARAEPTRGGFTANWASLRDRGSANAGQWGPAQRGVRGRAARSALEDGLRLEARRLLPDRRRDRAALSLARLRGLPCVPCKEAGCALGIVCDVGLTASPTLRGRLAGFGCSPSSTLVVQRRDRLVQAGRRAFRPALDGLGVSPADAAHIGDNERTDVAGAKALGMVAVQYTGLPCSPVAPGAAAGRAGGPRHGGPQGAARGPGLLGISRIDALARCSGVVASAIVEDTHTAAVRGLPRHARRRRDAVLDRGGRTRARR